MEKINKILEQIDQIAKVFGYDFKKWPNHSAADVLKVVYEELKQAHEQGDLKTQIREFVYKQMNKGEEKLLLELINNSNDENLIKDVLKKAQTETIKVLEELLNNDEKIFEIISSVIFTKAFRNNIRSLMKEQKN